MKGYKSILLKFNRQLFADQLVIFVIIEKPDLILFEDYSIHITIGRDKIVRHWSFQ